MASINLSQTQARRFLLAYQSLWPPHSLSGKEGILDYIHRTRCIQFDPLDIAGQNADLVLQSRMVDYKPAMLRELLYQDRLLLDGYDKNMSIYPIDDWPFFTRRRLSSQGNLRSSVEVAEIAPQIIAAIEARGPLSSLDLDFNQTVPWYWAPTRLARAALESLYLSGELVIHRKVHTRKVYDLTQRHIPIDLLRASEPNTTEADYQDWYILRRIGSVGMLWNRGGEIWLGVPGKSLQRTSSINRLIEQNKVHEVVVEGIDAPLYIRAQDQEFLEKVLNRQNAPERMAFIAPLDNLAWDRRLLEALFGFYYRWEVYTPQAKREFGYYVLPVLYGDRFVARIEPVRSKKNGTLTIKNWWWEPGANPTGDMVSALAECLGYFSTYLSVTQVNFNGHIASPDEIGKIATLISSIS